MKHLKAVNIKAQTIGQSVDAIDAAPIADSDKQKLYSLNSRRVFKL